MYRTLQGSAAIGYDHGDLGLSVFGEQKGHLSLQIFDVVFSACIACRSRVDIRIFSKPYGEYLIDQEQ